MNKDYDAAAIANSVAKRMLSRDVVSEGDYNVIYTSETFPTTAYGLAHNLNPELAEQIQDAFFSYDWEAVRWKPSLPTLVKLSSFRSPTKRTGQ